LLAGFNLNTAAPELSPSLENAGHRDALLLGVQEALWRLGGMVEVLRSDTLSAATHELPVSGGRALTRRYQSLLDHYGLKSTRIFPRKAHERLRRYFFSSPTSGNRPEACRSSFKVRERGHFCRKGVQANGLIPYAKSRTVFRPRFAPVVEPRSRYVGVAEPLLDLGDVSLVG
jgi:hypothetical protein